MARTGIQDYLGTEIDPNNDHGLRDVPIVKVYRPESSVFHADAMNSYAYRPMTNDHPGGDGVNSKNWKDVAVGNTGGEVIRDGQRVKVPLVLMDAKAITDFEAGKRQLSMGYGAEIIFKDGVTPEGDAYHVSLGPMKMNHLSLVHSARAGEEFRIGDHKPENPKGGHDMADSLRKLLVDGISIDVTEQGAQAIEKLAKQLNDAASTTKALNDAHSAALAVKDAALSKLQAELDDAKTKILSDAQIDARVKERADLIGVAKIIADGDYTGKTAAEIRKAAVHAKLGDAAVTGKDDAYIAVRFDILVEDAAKNPANDPVRSHFQAQDGKPAGNPAAAARAKMLEDLNSTQPAK
ncbi:Uncharacterized protein AC507_1670 [Pseudomonas syringae pv. maculicola]|nr:Uncharacterized protein AC507_1670 [Pseudomonas syringae pv. maculicola]